VEIRPSLKEMTIEELKSGEGEIRSRMEQLTTFLKIDEKLEELASLEEKMNALDFWNNKETAQATIAAAQACRNVIDPHKQLCAKLDDYTTALELASEDEEFLAEAESEYKVLLKDLDKLELVSFLSGPLDRNNFYFSVHAGAGGTESCDWASMALRMYRRYFERRGWKDEIIDIQMGDEAGVKSATLHVMGEFSYGYFKGERGVHRLVRISPFDSNARRHTSFCAVTIVPQVETDINIEINQEDIETEVFIHGALCFSSSGNCLMSSVIGGRSGNRGKCAQPCRKNYSLYNNEGILVENKALLSMKDLMTLEHIDKLIETGIHSLKIEGRMKSKEYVYTVVSSYRKAIDSYYEKVKYSVDEETLYNIKLVFNREFTKGYLFNEYNKDIVNINTVNHQGVVIGKIINRTNKFIDILLSKDISMHDGLRVNSVKPYGIFITNMIVNGNNVKTAKKGEVVINSAEAPESNYTIALICDFESIDDLNAYQVHPAHKKFGAFIAEIKTERACIDYEF
jgi:hypothetical protein